MLLPEIQHCRQCGPARGSHPSPVGVEEHVLSQQNAVLLDHDRRFVRAAILVVDAVDRLRFVRTSVRDIGDSVLVVVGIRAPVLVLETVEVLGLIGTLVHVVRNSIAVTIENLGLGHGGHGNRDRNLDRRGPVRIVHHDLDAEQGHLGV